MTKLAQLLQTARDNGWTVSDLPTGPTLTRDAVAGREVIDIYLTEHRTPRLHHAWYQLDNLDGRYNSTQRQQLLQLVTAPSGLEDDGPDPADREPSPEQERAWDLREDDARGHALV